MKHFTCPDGVEYEVDHFGVIHQLHPQPFTYDEKYCSTYDTPAYREKSNNLMALRLAFVVGTFGAVPRSLIDFGCGNGAFLKFAQQLIQDCKGYDITKMEIPGISIIHELQRADVYTFWDSFEHVPDLDFIADLDAQCVVMSLPYCHYNSMDEGARLGWFNEFYHRKPNEHLHHFDATSLASLMQYYGWKVIAKSHHEDIIRIPKNGQHNILTMAFER